MAPDPDILTPSERPAHWTAHVIVPTPLQREGKEARRQGGKKFLGTAHGTECQHGTEVSLSNVLGQRVAVWEEREVSLPFQYKASKEKEE